MEQETDDLEKMYGTFSGFDFCGLARKKVKKVWRVDITQRETPGKGGDYRFKNRDLYMKTGQRLLP